MQPLKTLKVCYGNCGRTRRATEFLDSHGQNNDADLCVYTEVIQAEVSNRDAANIQTIDSVDPHASTIRIYENDSLSLRAAPRIPCELLCAAYLLWSNMKLCIFSIYLTRNTEIMPRERFETLITKLFTMASNLSEADMVLIVGDFNAYHSSWSTENCSHSYKRQRGDFLHNAISNAGMFVLNDLRRGFTPTWMRGDTNTVNDLYIGCVGMDAAVTYVTHEMLDGSDHRLLTMGFDAEAALLSLQQKGRIIEGLEYRDGSVRLQA